MSFDDQIQKKVQETILKQISECRYVDYHHSNKRQIPNDILENAWMYINWQEVTEFVSKELQSKVCQTIVQNMLTETKTDVKAILSIQGVREKLRIEAYPSIMKALGIENK